VTVLDGLFGAAFCVTNSTTVASSHMLKLWRFLATTSLATAAACYTGQDVTTASYAQRTATIDVASRTVCIDPGTNEGWYANLI